MTERPPATIEFIRSTATRLDLKSETVAMATSVLLNSLSNRIEARDHEELLESLPGARDLANLIPGDITSPSSSEGSTVDSETPTPSLIPQSLAEPLRDIGLADIQVPLFVTLFVYFLSRYASTQ